MALTIGTQLGSYEITALLGKGGMGEVYRAKDSKLKRDVAIKTLPEEFSRDPERVGRFQREAEALALLNHPNIGAIYDIQQSNESRFLVLELVEGETLSDRVGRGPIPVEEALKIAQLIAEALEAAHEKGIVHRDLKPANVKLTLDDKVKVLDFGLAKAMESTTASATLSNSPTLSLAATQAGAILGTAAYMSPEQAKGFTADFRSDVFAFGCVLFEILTGRQLFQGETIHEILGAVLVSQPDLSVLPANLNPKIADVLRRCLEKNPKRRWQAIGDLRVELETLALQPHAVPVTAQTATVPQPLWKRAIPIAITAIVVGIGARLIPLWNPQPSAPAIVTRFSVSVPEGKSISGNPWGGVSMSPDGKAFTFLANYELYLRSMSEPEPRQIFSMRSGGGDARITTVFFSSDGQWIGFYANQDNTLRKIAVTGGAAVTLCKAQAPNGISWSGDQIVFSQPKGIMRVSANGGEPELLAASASSQEFMSDPQLLNDGTSLLFTVTKESGASRWDKADIVVQSVKSGERKVLVHGGSTVRYIPTGHLVYALGGTLFAIRFDAKKLRVEGGPVPILEGVLRGSQPQNFSGAAQFSFSNTGSLTYFPGPAGGTGETGIPPQTLALADRNGKVQPLGLPPQPIYHPRSSPDGKQLVFGTDDGNEGIIWVYDLKGNGPARRLTFGGSNLNPIWSRDGRYITFASDREGDRGLFRQLADGTAPAERLTKAELGPSQRPEQWSPDGKTLSFIMNNRADGTGNGSDLFTLTLDGERKPQPLVRSPSNKRYSAFSPDGHWFAYASGENSNVSFNLFVEPFPPTGSRYQVTSMGGRDPVWSPDGKELFFNTQVQSNLIAGHLVSVDVRTQSGFTFGQPKPIPIPGAILGGNGRNYDITPDGKQFVVVVPPPNASGEQTRRAPQQINVVLNWFTELQQRVPVK
jgi:eukaryotic-like serine/threonine-protein kinase